MLEGLAYLIHENNSEERLTCNDIKNVTCQKRISCFKTRLQTINSGFYCYVHIFTPLMSLVCNKVINYFVKQCCANSHTHIVLSNLKSQQSLL